MNKILRKVKLFSNSYKDNEMIIELYDN